MMKKLKALLCTLIMGVALIGLLPFFSSVECASNPVLTISGVTSGEKTKIEKTMNDCNTDIKSSEDSGIGAIDVIKTTSDKDGSNYIVNIEFDMSAYNNLGQASKQEVMRIILVNVEASSMSQMSRSKIYNFISNNDKSTSSLVRQLSNDVTADFASAYSSFKPFSGVIGWILGLITLAIFIMLGLTIVVDIAYIVIPIFQNFLSSESDKAKPKYVSSEAWNSVKGAEEGTTFKEPLGIYFKLKTKQFLALGICVLYLVSGQIYNVIARIIDSFSGILG